MSASPTSSTPTTTTSATEERHPQDQQTGAPNAPPTQDVPVTPPAIHSIQRFFPENYPAVPAEHRFGPFTPTLPGIQRLPSPDPHGPTTYHAPTHSNSTPQVQQIEDLLHRALRLPPHGPTHQPPNTQPTQNGLGPPLLPQIPDPYDNPFFVPPQGPAETPFHQQTLQFYPPTQRPPSSAHRQPTTLFGDHHLPQPTATSTPTTRTPQFPGNQFDPNNPSTPIYHLPRFLQPHSVRATAIQSADPIRGLPTYDLSLHQHPTNTSTPCLVISIPEGTPHYIYKLPPASAILALNHRIADLDDRDILIGLPVLTSPTNRQTNNTSRTPSR